MNLKVAYITAAAAMMAVVATVWAAVVDPRYARPDDLKPMMEQIGKNQQMIETLSSNAANEIKGIKVSIIEMRIDIIQTRLMELDTLKGTRKLRVEEIYQVKDYQAKLERLVRELKRVEG